MTLSSDSRRAQRKNVNPTKKEEIKSERRVAARGTGLIYPEEIEADDRYVTFTVFEFKRRGAEQAENKKELARITLPMPATLANQDQFEYEDFDAGVAANLLSGVTDFGLDSLLNAAGNLFSSQGGGEAAQRAAFAAAKGTSTGAAGVVQQTAGFAFNPRKSTVFQSPSLKEYSFEFKMVAKNQDESEAIRKIVNRFRFHSYPDVETAESGTYILPDTFQIRFHPDDFLFKPNTCVLTGMAVTYNGDNTPTFFDNGAPVEVSLSLAFKEVETDTKQSLIDREKI